MPTTYTSIPIEIEAVAIPDDFDNFSPDVFLRVLANSWGSIVENNIRFDSLPHLGKRAFRILTNHGIVDAGEGDYIIKNGDEVYPCKAEVFKAKYREGRNNVLTFSKKGSTNQDADEALNNLKKAISSKAIIVASVNENGSFDSFVSDEVRDIDFCYAIDCLKERRKIRLEEIRS